MFTGGRTYGRRPVAVAKVRTEADDVADAIFGPPKTIPVFLPPVPVPSAASDSSESPDSSPESVRRPTRKPAKRQKKTARDSVSPGQEEEDDIRRDLRHGSKESCTSKKSDRDADYAGSETGSHTHHKKPVRKKPAPLPPSIFPSTAAAKARRKKAPSEAPSERPDPNSDPDYVRFMQQMEDLKGHTIEIQDESEYWTETARNAAKDVERLVNETRDNHPSGYSLESHRKRSAEKALRKKGLQTVVEEHDADESEAEPLESTRLSGSRSRRRRRSPQITETSHIPDQSPMNAAGPKTAQRSPERDSTVFVRPKLSTRRIEASSVWNNQGVNSPLESTPLDNRRNSARLNLNVSAVPDQSPIVAKNLSRNFQAMEGELERINTIATELEQKATSTMRPVDSRRNLSEKDRSAVQPSLLPQVTLPGQKAKATSMTYKLSARQRRDLEAGPSNVASRVSAAEATTSRHGNTAGPAPTPAPSGRNLQTPGPTTSYSSHVSRISHATPSASPRVSRNLLPLFSPAVFGSEEDRRVFSQSQATKSSRRSVVVSANQQSPFERLRQIATPKKVISTDHILTPEYTQLTKIGEGSYADVYSVFKNGEQIILKIVAVNGLYRNGDKQTTYADILSECMISVELTSDLLQKSSPAFFAPVFAKTHFIKIAKGQYPDEFCDRHDSFARANEDDALNQIPQVYLEDQHYVIIGLNNGGQELDKFPLANFSQAKSIFQQLALGLAAAEQALEFEHRDVHLSNILVKVTQENAISFLVNGLRYEVPSHGVHVTIIDWTLSRMKNGETIVYKDLAEDEKIFEGTVGEEQFDVYRDMKARNANNWEAHHPWTNVRWIKYLWHELLNTKEIASGGPAKDKKLLKDVNAKNRLLLFQSAFDLVQREKMFQACRVVDREEEV